MSDIILTPQLGNVGERPCYPNEQARYVDFMTKTVWVLPLGQLSGVWISDVPPADQTNIWFKINPTTGGMVYPSPFIYSTVLGQWIATHPRPALDKEVMIWKGTENELWNYDGGDGTDPGASGTNPTVSTGSFWWWDRDYDDRVPGGYDDTPGTLAAQDTDYDLFPAASSGAGVQVRSVIFARRTTRVFWTP